MFGLVIPIPLISPQIESSINHWQIRVSVPVSLQYRIWQCPTFPDSLNSLHSTPPISISNPSPKRRPNGHRTPNPPKPIHSLISSMMTPSSIVMWITKFVHLSSLLRFLRFRDSGFLQSWIERFLLQHLSNGIRSEPFAGGLALHLPEETWMGKETPVKWHHNTAPVTQRRREAQPVETKDNVYSECPRVDRAWHFSLRLFTLTSANWAFSLPFSPIFGFTD